MKSMRMETQRESMCCAHTATYEQYLETNRPSRMASPLPVKRTCAVRRAYALFFFSFFFFRRVLLCHPVACVDGITNVLQNSERGDGEDFLTSCVKVKGRDYTHCMRHYKQRGIKKILDTRIIIRCVSSVFFFFFVFLFLDEYNEICHRARIKYSIETALCKYAFGPTRVEERTKQIVLVSRSRTSKTLWCNSFSLCKRKRETR